MHEWNRMLYKFRLNHKSRIGQSYFCCCYYLCHESVALCVCVLSLWPFSSVCQEDDNGQGERSTGLVYCLLLPSWLSMTGHNLPLQGIINLTTSILLIEFLPSQLCYLIGCGLFNWGRTLERERERERERELPESRISLSTNTSYNLHRQLAIATVRRINQSTPDQGICARLIELSQATGFFSQGTHICTLWKVKEPLFIEAILIDSYSVACNLYTLAKHQFTTPTNVCLGYHVVLSVRQNKQSPNYYYYLTSCLTWSSFTCSLSGYTIRRTNTGQIVFIVCTQQLCEHSQWLSLVSGIVSMFQQTNSH